MTREGHARGPEEGGVFPTWNVQLKGQRKILSNASSIMHEPSMMFANGRAGTTRHLHLLLIPVFLSFHPPETFGSFRHTPGPPVAIHGV